MLVPDRKGVCVSGECRVVLLSLFVSHSCPLLSRVPSVNESAVCVSHESSMCVCSRSRELDCLICAPNPSDVSAPDGVEIATCFRRVRLAEREDGFERIPPGEGRAAMCDNEEDVCRDEDCGS